LSGVSGVLRLRLALVFSTPSEMHLQGLLPEKFCILVAIIRLVHH
jgi:hypothetical protein